MLSGEAAVATTFSGALLGTESKRQIKKSSEQHNYSQNMYSRCDETEIDKFTWIGLNLRQEFQAL